MLLECTEEGKGLDEDLFGCCISCQEGLRGEGIANVASISVPVHPIVEKVFLVCRTKFDAFTYFYGRSISKA